MIEMKWFSDSAHGWLRVSTKQLFALGLEQDISNYSYISESGQSVYLEEDSDAGIFIDAYGRSKFYKTIDASKATYYDGRCHIRNYRRYYPEYVYTLADSQGWERG
jgi:hypothetical protein